MSKIQRSHLKILLEITRDLTSSLAAEDRYQRLLAAVRRIIPCDAACLMRLDGEELVPLAGHGLGPEALVRRYPRREHPRLDIILSSEGVVRFPLDSSLPDPFDGLLEKDSHALQQIHACMGYPLKQGGELIGVLTADSLTPHAFDDLDWEVVEGLGALAGAALHTTALIDALEDQARHKGAVVRELQRSATGSGQIIGASPATRRMLEDMAVVTRSEVPVLITGETGVGKEVVARQIHLSSPRGDEALIQVNCAALPEAIAESELFGHVAGAFTGATRDRSGKFELANGGTLFLDEVGELPLTLQPKLLRALQQGEIQRVGEDRVIRVDVRILAATNRDLEAEVAEGRFRADLFHRLAVYPLRVPPLRERREDISLLSAYFMDLTRRRLGLGPLRLSSEARSALARAPWQGNVRELENVLNRAVLRASAGNARATVVVGLEHLDLPVDSRRERDDADDLTPTSGGRSEGLSLRLRVQEFQRRQIEAAVERNDGNWAAAARDLGLHRSNLHHLATRLGLRKPAARD